MQTVCDEITVDKRPKSAETSGTTSCTLGIPPRATYGITSVPPVLSAQLLTAGAHLYLYVDSLYAVCPQGSKAM